MAERAAQGRQTDGRASPEDAGEEHASPPVRSLSGSGSDDARSEEARDGEMVEALEELVLEAYNNMQSDGEFIFLPDHVARKLHEASRLLRLEGDEEPARPGEPSPEPADAVPSNSTDGCIVGSPAAATDVVKMIGELATAQLGSHEPPDTAGTHVADAVARGGYPERRREQQERLSQAMLPRTRSSELLFSELEPVIEIDEEASSGPSSPAGDRDNTQYSHTSPPPPSSSRSMPPPPPSSSHAASTRTPHPGKTHAASPATTPRSADEKESRSAASTYEKRRKAALKLKEEKARRAQEKHDAAKKQREDARRELEEVQRKEMEEKRERVKRMRQQREQRKSATKPAR